MSFIGRILGGLVTGLFIIWLTYVLFTEVQMLASVVICFIMYSIWRSRQPEEKVEDPNPWG